MYFSQTFLTILVVAALICIAASVVTLMTFLIRDAKSKKIW